MFLTIWSHGGKWSIRRRLGYQQFQVESLYLAQFRIQIQYVRQICFIWKVQLGWDFHLEIQQQMTNWQLRTIYRLWYNSSKNSQSTNPSIFILLVKVGLESTFLHWLMKSLITIIKLVNRKESDSKGWWSEMDALIHQNALIWASISQSTIINSFMIITSLVSH